MYPLLFFFQPNNSPVTETKKKNTNSNAPVDLWTFRNTRKIFACFCLLSSLGILIICRFTYQPDSSIPLIVIPSASPAFAKALRATALFEAKNFFSKNVSFKSGRILTGKILNNY